MIAFLWGVFLGTTGTAVGAAILDWFCASRRKERARLLVGRIGEDPHSRFAPWPRPPRSLRTAPAPPADQESA